MMRTEVTAHVDHGSMTWKIAYKSLPAAPVEEIVVDVTTRWEVVKTVRSQREADSAGKVVHVKAGE